MNVGNYITSGILQDYCLGTLSVDEEKKVEIMCHNYPDVAYELELLKQTLKKYTTNDSIISPEELRMKVWIAVKKIWEENQ